MLVNETPQENEEILWNRYLFLTQEIKKFIDNNDSDLVTELLKQRMDLQEIIENTPDGGFKKSVQGQMIFEKLSTLERDIKFNLQVYLNKSRQQQTVVNAYDQLGRVNAGRRIDWQR